MPNIKWLDTEAKISLKQLAWTGIFSRRYSFLLMYSLQIDSNELETTLGPYIKQYVFLKKPEFNIPKLDLDSLFNTNKPASETSEGETRGNNNSVEKVRGTLMIVEDIEVPKSIYDKYREDDNIKIQVDSTDPKNIRFID